MAETEKDEAAELPSFRSFPGLKEVGIEAMVKRSKELANTLVVVKEQKQELDAQIVALFGAFALPRSIDVKGYRTTYVPPAKPKSLFKPAKFKQYVAAKRPDLSAFMEEAIKAATEKSKAAEAASIKITGMGDLEGAEEASE